MYGSEVYQALDSNSYAYQVVEGWGKLPEGWTWGWIPAAIFFDPQADLVHIAELDHQVSVYTLGRELVVRWGGGQPSDRPGEFLGHPHGIWMDSQGSLYVGEVGVDGRLQKFVRQTSSP